MVDRHAVFNLFNAEKILSLTPLVAGDTRISFVLVL